MLFKEEHGNLLKNPNYTHLYRVASTRIEPLQGDPWLSGLHVDRLPGVVPLVDDDVLVLLRGDVRLPRYVEAAGDRGNILDYGRGRTLRSVNLSDFISYVPGRVRNRKFEWLMI